MRVGARLKTSSKVAVIGCGNWGKNLIRNFHALGGLYAVSDKVATQAADYAAQYNVPALSFEAILQDPAIDGCVIATPSHTHALLATQCLMAGKHVYIEKPFTTNTDEALQLTKLAQSKSKVLMVGHLLQYHDVFLYLKEQVHNGLIGKLQYCRFERTNCGKFPAEKSVLWDYAPHDLSMLLAITKKMPLKLQAKNGNFFSHTHHDTVSLDFTFADNVHANIYVSWLHPTKSQKAIIVGSEGMIVFDDTLPWEQKCQLSVFPPDWEDGLPKPVALSPVPMPVPPQSEPLKQECQHFLTCIETGQTPRTDGVEASNVVQLLACAEKAFEAQSIIELDV